MLRFLKPKTNERQGIISAMVRDLLEHTAKHITLDIGKTRGLIGIVINCGRLQNCTLSAGYNKCALKYGEKSCLETIGFA